MTSFAALILLVSGIGFLGFGAAYALWPGRMAGLTDIGVSTATARADFTATYGGFQLGFGVFLLVCSGRTGWLEPGLYAATVALCGFGGVRAVTILLNRGRVRGTIWVGLALELFGAALNGWALGKAP